MRLEPDPERMRLSLARAQPFASREAGSQHSEAVVPWHRWGPYLAERHWATVREDYSALGTAWDFFPHDHARSRAYRWGEDGLLGICDDQMRLCFALALWNGVDPILKERLFGLTGDEGNHGEDVKECYYFLDGTPTHSYLRALYKYPQTAFPYAELVAESRRRGRFDPEYELVDTGIFAEDRYFDVMVEYAKADPTDIVIRLSITNRGPSDAALHVLPTVWFRNTWSWGHSSQRPALRCAGDGLIAATHPELGRYWLAGGGAPELLFTDNDTNRARLWAAPNAGRYVKDGIDDAIVHGRLSSLNPDLVGTKASMHYRLALAPGRSQIIMLRLTNHELDAPFADAPDIVALRQSEADLFYATGFGLGYLTDDERSVQRQAFAGLLWSKQVYIWDIEAWLTPGVGLCARHR